MHPLFTAWVIYDKHCDDQPLVPTRAFTLWLARAEELSDWFNTLRRLQF